MGLRVTPDEIRNDEAAELIELYLLYPDTFDEQARQRIASRENANLHASDCTLYTEPDKGKQCDCGYSAHMIKSIEESIDPRPRRTIHEWFDK